MYFFIPHFEVVESPIFLGAYWTPCNILTVSWFEVLSFIALHPRPQMSVIFASLQAWWCRMSNRFRHLKVTRTFSKPPKLSPYMSMSSGPVEQNTSHRVRY